MGGTIPTDGDPRPDKEREAVWTLPFIALRPAISHSRCDAFPATVDRTLRLQPQTPFFLSELLSQQQGITSPRLQLGSLGEVGSLALGPL